MLNLQFGTLCQVLNERGLARVSVLREHGEDLYQLHDAHLHGGSFEAVRNGDPVAFTLDETHQPRAGQYQRVAQAVLLSHDCFQEYESPPGTMRFSMKSAAEILAPQWVAERRAGQGGTAPPAVLRTSGSDVTLEVPEYLSSRSRGTPDTMGSSPRDMQSPRDLFNAAGGSTTRDQYSREGAYARTPLEGSAARSARFVMGSRAASGPELLDMKPRSAELDWTQPQTRRPVRSDAPPPLDALRRPKSASDFDLPSAMGQIARPAKLTPAVLEEMPEDESFFNTRKMDRTPPETQKEIGDNVNAPAMEKVPVNVAKAVSLELPDNLDQSTKCKSDDSQDSDSSTTPKSGGDTPGSSSGKKSRLPLAAPKKEAADTPSPPDETQRNVDQAEDALRRDNEDGVTKPSTSPSTVAAPAPAAPPQVPRVHIEESETEEPRMRIQESARTRTTTGNPMLDMLPLECPVCADVYLDPVTIPTCGHSFCLMCLHQVEQRTRDGPPVCPTCRKPSGSFKGLAISMVLRDVCERLHPRELAQKRAEIAAEAERSPVDNIRETPSFPSHGYVKAIPSSYPMSRMTHHAPNRPPVRHPMPPSQQSARLSSPTSVLEFAQAVFQNASRAANAPSGRPRFDDPSELAALFEQQLRYERQREAAHAALREVRDPRDLRDYRDAHTRDPRDLRDARDMRDPRDHMRDARELRDSRDPRDPRGDPRERGTPIAAEALAGDIW